MSNIPTSGAISGTNTNGSKNTKENGNGHVNGLNPSFDFSNINIEDIKEEEAKHSRKTNEAYKKKANEVRESLLKEINSIDIRHYLQLPEEEDLKQKHIVVAVVKRLLEVAKNKYWNLCKTFDYVYIYNGAYWLQMDKDDLKSFLGKCAIQMGCPDYEAAHYEFKDKLFKQFLADAHLPPPPVDENKILINLLNGTLEFTPDGWKLRPFDPNEFLTYQLPFCYDPSAEYPLFNNYLLKVLPDEASRLILQEFAGYPFTGLNLEKMLMLIGGGANGKSLFFNVYKALLGKENILTYPMGLFAHEYNRARLTNVLVNYSSEKGTDLDPDTFKALISGEPRQAREPYGKPFTLYNKVRFIINANELPRETEQTDAYFRRWLIIPFDVKITEAEKDTELADKIIANELPGVLNWMLKGLNRLITNKKFTPCDKADKALGEFKRQSDSVALFVDELRYIPSNDGKNKKALADLFRDYKTFCQEDGYKHVGKNKFSNRFENKGFEKTRLNDGTAAFFVDVKTSEK